MRRPVSRIVLLSATVLGGACLFQSGNLTCGSFASEAAIASLDMCFIFDCTNGAFGGLIDPCGTVLGTDTNPEGGTGDEGFPGPSTGPFFADCPTDDETF